MKKKLLLFCALFIAICLTASHAIISVGDAAPRNTSPLAPLEPPAVPSACDPFTFAPAGDYWVEPGSGAVKVGDFNGDGEKDIVRVGEWANPDNPNQRYLSISTLLGDSTGRFSVSPPLESSGYITSMAVGEFNGDGRHDVAAIYYEDQLGFAGILILLGNEAGELDFRSYYETYFYSLAVGDFNFDGIQDVAASAENGTVSVLLVDGTGAITLASTFLADPYVVFAVGDFNADGMQDLVNHGPGQDVSLRLSTGGGTFAAPVYFSAGDVAPGSVKVGDFNLDGNQDLVTGNYDTANVSVLPGNGAGSFGIATTFAVGANGALAAVGDFNRDGTDDIATESSSGVAVLFGNGSGGFGNLIHAGGPARLESHGDFNGDGRQDITAVVNSSVSVFLANCRVPTPTPTATTPTATRTPIPTPLVTVGGRHRNHEQSDLLQPLP